MAANSREGAGPQIPGLAGSPVNALDTPGFAPGLYVTEAADGRCTLTLRHAAEGWSDAHPPISRYPRSFRRRRQGRRPRTPLPERRRPVPLFRDLAGNHYNIPADELERFQVKGQLPEDARLTGLEAPTAPPPGRPPLPRYVWQEAEHGEGGPQYTVVAPPGTPAALAGRTYLLVPVEPAGGG